MGIVVLALRTYYIFSNLYGSFKILKLPPPSSRNNGQPSIRALSQRKRDMKGWLTVWIVWCCIVLYETHVENIVSIFIPFYDEIKSVILLILIMSRARGAEPIYLHVIRPLVKPYVPLIDPILATILSIGDFLLLAISLPFYPLISWWRRGKSAQSASNKTNASQSRPRSHANDATAQLKPPTDTKGQQRSDSRLYASQQTQKAQNHQIWHPPSSTYDDDGPPPEYNSPPPPMPVPQPYIHPSHTDTDLTSLDWRAYPPFPSAYPPTPLPPQRVAASESFRSEKPHIYAIPENGNGRIGGVSGIADRYEVESEQDFHTSLLPPREPSNPTTDGSSSDDMNMQGVQPTYTDLSTATTSTVSGEDEDEDMDNDDDYVDEEDSFDITLRTPRQVRLAADKYSTSRHSRTILSFATAASVVSNDSESILTTPPHHRIASRTSATSRHLDVSDSTSPSLAGQKRQRVIRSPSKVRMSISPRKQASRIVRPAYSSTARRIARTRSKSSSILSGLDSGIVESDEELMEDDWAEEGEEQTLDDENDSDDSVDSSSAVVSKRRKVARPTPLAATPRRRNSPAKASLSKEQMVKDRRRPAVAATRTSSLRAAKVRAGFDKDRTPVKGKVSAFSGSSKAASRDGSSTSIDKAGVGRTINSIATTQSSKLSTKA